MHRHVLREFLRAEHPPSRAQIAALALPDVNAVLADLDTPINPDIPPTAITAFMAQAITPFFWPPGPYLA